jgi:phosphoglycerol transferase MdoB-like AlkP superfamily enzyme
LQLGLLQKWGVPDEYLYARALSDLTTERQPFFSMLYTISSHEPFDIQGYNKFDGSDAESKYLNAAAYADSCLGVFIDSLRQTDIWDNTLVAITADHTSLWPGPSNITEPSTYRVPLILLGGVIKENKLIERFGNHNDFGPMLLKQLGHTPKKDMLSKDFLVDGNYAFYFRQEGWGYMSPEMGWFYNVDTQMQDFFYNNAPEKTDSLMRFAKAYVQYLHSDPLSKK